MTRDKLWTAEDIPDQSGRIVVVTGANSGLGFETARALARKGARVVMACRSVERGNRARQSIRAGIAGARLEVRPLDLASLASISAFASDFNAQRERLDLLINNAGIMAPPYQKTADGFELQFGTNHLGHFALTGLLLERLLATPQSRVVTVSSSAELMGRITFNDLMKEKRYERWIAYAQSKLANLLFAYELQRKLAARKNVTISLGANPGFAATNLRNVQLTKDTPPLHGMLFRLSEAISIDVRMGVLPQLYAATAPEARGGEYYAPDGFLQIRGYPRLARSSPQSHNEEVARRLWQVSEDLTGIQYTALA